MNKLNNFVQCMNELHPDITFTMETEKDGMLPLLDVLGYRNKDDSLGNKLYQKTTHTNL